MKHPFRRHTHGQNLDMNPRWIEVAAGAIVSPERNSVLLALRRADQHQGNLWEFPGGKLEAGEEADAALVRELAEEIAISVTSLSELIVVEHDYGDKAVRLHVFIVNEYNGKPAGLEGQSLRWVPLGELTDYPFPDANVPIVTALMQALGD